MVTGTCRGSGSSEKALNPGSEAHSGETLPSNSEGKVGDGEDEEEEASRR